MIGIQFKENLYNFRKMKKLTQRELADLVGVDQRTVSAWEKGICEPSFACLAKLCEIFEETFDGLLT
jgi:transcriptional regulator with XRE-family HTH domain